MAEREEEMDGQSSSEESEEPWKTTIRNSYAQLVEDMYPDPLLDFLKEKRFARTGILRDIEEAPTTSEKNRKILDLVLRKHSRGFELFLSLLKRSGNDGVAKLLGFKDEEDSGDEADDKSQKHGEQPVKEMDNIQKHLVASYKKCMGWENPCQAWTEGWDIYVGPEIKINERKSDVGHMKKFDRQTPSADAPFFMASEKMYFQERHGTSSFTLTSLSDLFSSDHTQPCKNIYLTGDAGSGKSTICRRIVSTWCKAVNNVNDNSIEHDIKFMARFKYVFYIQLRNISPSKYRINDMIQEQLLYEDSVEPSPDIKDILKKEKCLIILDGLDEWTMPKDALKTPDMNEHIPRRAVSDTETTFFTTSRSWKYDMINLNSHEADREIKVCGLGKDSSSSLATSLLKHLDQDKNKESDVKLFQKYIEEKKLSDLSSVPVLLILMVTLWHNEKDIGESQVQLFCSMVDLLLELAKKHNSSSSDGKCETKANELKLPNCFTDKQYCQDYQPMLLSLAELAFQTLFNQQREQTLVFSDLTMKKFRMSDSDIEQCLNIGILSRNKDLEYYARRRSTYSFLHKKVQEFLAALHIATSDPAIVDQLKQTCNTLDVMTEMYQVWLFLSGMNCDLSSQMIAHLAECMNADQRVRDYRCSGDLYDSQYCEMIKDIQSYIVNCINEIAKSGQKLDNVMLPDLFIDDDKLSNVAQSVPYTDRSVKSVYLCSINLKRENVIPVTGHLEKCSSLEKLVLFDSYPKSQIPNNAIAKIANTSCNTLNWLRLSFVKLRENTIPDSINCSVIRLLYCKAPHEVYEKTLAVLAKMPNVNQLVVDIECTVYDQPENTSCIGHDRQCRPTLDVSVWPKLKKLELHCLKANGLASVADDLEEITLTDVTLTKTDLCNFVDKLSNVIHTVTVKLVQVKVTSATVELEEFFQNRRTLTEPDCRHDDIYDTWDISFVINEASGSGSGGTD